MTDPSGQSFVSCSGPIRQNILVTQKRLQNCLTELKKTDLSFVPESDRVKQLENLPRLESLCLVIDNFMKRIKSSVETLSEQNKEWLSLHKQLPKDQLIHENTLYDTWTKGTDNFLVNIADGSDVITNLESKLIELRNVINKIQSPAFASVTPGTASFHAPILSTIELPQTTVHLPKLQLSQYHGDPLKWTEYWDSFESSVHSQNISPVQKFNYLISTLRGAAYKSIEGISVTNSNYQIALDILKKRFGDPNVIKRYLYSDLRKILPSSNKTTDLRHCLESIERVCRQLGSVGEDLDQPTLIMLILEKLPSSILIELGKLKPSSEKWEMNKLLKNLHDIISVREEAYQISVTCSLRETEQRSHVRFQNTPPIPSSTDAFLSTAAYRNQNPMRTQNRVSCAFCHGSHYSDQCITFSTVRSRKTKIQEQKLCYRCLRTGHMANACQATRPCIYCKGNHNRAMCPRTFEHSVDNVNLDVEPTSSTETHFAAGDPSSIVLEEQSMDNVPPARHIDVQSSVLMSSYPISNISLMLAKVKVINLNRDSDFVEAYVFFDTGSQKTFITHALSSKLSLTDLGKELISVNTFASKKPQYISTKNVNFGLLLKDNSVKEIYASSVPSITEAMALSNLRTEDIWELELNDYSEDVPEHFTSKTIIKPDILIGMDYFWEFIDRPSIIQLPSGLYAIPTSVGMVFSGKQSYQALSVKVNVDESQKLGEQTELSEENDDSKYELDVKNLELFWNLETIGIKDIPHITDDDVALEMFSKTVCFSDHRYHVKWPWKLARPELKDNYGLCFGRLSSLMKRFKYDPNLLSKYNQIIQEQLSKNIIEKVDFETYNLKHYLPHHPVVTPQKTTTKVRIVYDASAKVTKNDKSLNDCLYRGPILLPDLCGLLIRFRMSSIAIIADIEKAFLQVALQASDRDVTRFLWLKDPTKPTLENNVQIYRFCRVPFGVISSPFLLNATIKYHLNQKQGNISKQLYQNLYVDNLIIGTETEEQAMIIYRETKEIFKDASMNLREWNSNSRSFMDRIEPQDKIKSSETKVLGIAWDVNNDILKLELKFDSSNTNAHISKREVLKQLASTFDPLGLLAPVLLSGKLFLQDLWKRDLSWDEGLPTELEQRWMQIRNEWNLCSVFLLNRLISIDVGQKVQHYLIGFADASKSAYATCVYLKSVSPIGTVTVHLVFAKSRLAPTKEITIPRLELLGTMIGVKALNFVESQIGKSILAKFLFTDSEIVLHWLYSNKPQGTFIENRLNVIREHPGIKIQHVKSKDNPADLATRTISPSELETSSLWWHGPTWLKENNNTWPQNKFSDKENVSTEGSAVVTPITEPDEQIEPMIDLNHFNSLQKALNCMVYTLRFLKIKIWNKFLEHQPDQNRFQKLRALFRNVQNSGPISVNEVITSEFVIVKELQKLCYFEFIETLRENKKNPPNFKNLGINLDKQGVLRCFGRLQNAHLSEDCKFPILIPRKTAFSRLVILDRHKKVMHFGVNHTLSELRRHYWIPKGRSEVQRILKQCFICKKYNSGPYQLPRIPPYPKERVIQSKPFQYIGLDYLGPLWIKQHAMEKSKIWICLFTCLTTRAIHLEHVMNLSTETFLNCMRRFIARRGKPGKIISDNATQFKLAKQVIDNVWSELIRDETVICYFSSQKISWLFITEYAPWQGGFYERLVGLVKQAIRKSIGRNVLNFEQFITLLPEVEAVINTRPLVYAPDDFDSQKVLRPIDLISPQAEVGIPLYEENHDEPEEMVLPSSTETLIQYWKATQKTLDSFWDNWSKDYLLSLREKSAMHHRAPRVHSPNKPKLNEIVLVKTDNLPRGMWKLGKIVHLTPSTDAHVRSAQIELPNKTIIHRPVNLLYPLELSTELQEMDVAQEQEISQSVIMNTIPNLQLRTAFGIPSQSTLALTILLLMICCPLCTSTGVSLKYHCKHYNFKNVIYSEYCAQSGIVVQQYRTRFLCYSKVSCPTGHLSVDGRCGPKCKCPKWATDCSHYEGIAPEIIGNQQEILSLSKPTVCSFEQSSNCDTKPIHTTFYQIELYDNSLHYVKSLQLIHSAPDAHNFSCFGEGGPTETIGTPDFCENHRCNNKHGTRFCLYPQPEIVKFVNEDGQIPIKSWGIVPVTIFHSKSHGSDSVHPTCMNCSLHCIQGGIELILEEHTDLVEICSLPFCYRISHPRTTEIVQFPTEIVIKPHDFEAKIWSKGMLIKVISVHCTSSPYCEMIKCYLCLDMLYNPQCAPKFVLFFVLLVTYIFLGIIYFIIRTIKPLVSFARCLTRAFSKLFRCLCSSTFKLCRRTQTLSQHTSMSQQIGSSSLSFKPTLGTYSLSITILFLCLLNQCTGCANVASLTAQSTSCFNKRNGSIECTISESSLLSLVPQGQETCLLIHNDHNEPLGTISLEVRKISLECQVKNEYYTRSFTMHVQSSKRCYPMGSCHGDKCVAVTLNSMISELDDEANKFPGFTYCAESCGCAACGCITCSSACLFYRTFAKPATDKIFELFSCPLWNYKIDLVITINMPDESYSHSFSMKPGIPLEWQNMRLVIPSISSPPVPILGSQFLTDGHRTVLVQASASGQPVSGTIGQLQCSSRERAEVFQCHLPEDICNCQAQESRASCSCNEHNLEQLFETENLLPLIMEGISISGHGNHLEAEYNKLTALEIQITMEGFRLRTSVNKNKCNVKVHEVSGCYNCLSGAKLTYTCKTDFGKALAHVTCGKSVFSTVCTENDIVYDSVLNFDHAQVNETCRVSCPAGQTEFQISANLIFIPKYSMNSVANVVTTVKNYTQGELDYSFMISSLFSYSWLTLLIIFGSALLFVPVACSVIPRILLGLFKLRSVEPQLGNSQLKSMPHSKQI